MKKTFLILLIFMLGCATVKNDRIDNFEHRLKLMRIIYQYHYHYHHYGMMNDTIINDTLFKTFR